MEKDYRKQIIEMTWLLGKEDLKFIKQIYTMMYHYIKKRKWLDGDDSDN